MKKNITIKDIARIVKVTPTTVSLALNNHPRVSKARKQQILAVAKQLNYRPNLVARSLIKGKSQTIGLAITTIMNPFYSELSKGIQDTAHELDYNIILCNTNYDTRLENYYIDMLLSRGVDGILFSSVVLQDANLKPLLDDNFPFVLVSRRIHHSQWDSKIDYIVLDNEAGGHLAMAHLKDLGHRRIGILAGDMRASTAHERTLGAKRLLREAGIPFDPDLFIICNYSRAEAYKATQRLLNLESPPTAIFAQNDHMALGSREAILEAGLRIPEDISLIGFDNIDISGLKGIELTTIAHKSYQMGKEAVRLLVDRIEQNAPPNAQQVVLDPELVIRKSCRAYGPTLTATSQL